MRTWARTSRRFTTRSKRFAPSASRSLDFETFVIIDTHWHTTLDFVVNASERLRGVYTSDEIPDMLHEYEYDYPGDPELADAIVAEAQASWRSGRNLAASRLAGSLRDAQPDALLQSAAEQEACSFDQRL